MFSEPQEVLKEFKNLFENLTVNGVKIPVCYYKVSASDYTEVAENPKYPIIVIQDYQPTLNERWFVDLKRYVGIELGEGAILHRRPLLLDFKFDLSIASKSFKEFNALKSIFLQRFTFDEAFLFRETVINDTKVGIPVRYKVTPTDIPRTDGVYECNYEYTLEVLFELSEEKYVDYLQTLNIEINED